MALSFRFRLTSDCKTKISLSERLINFRLLPQSHIRSTAPSRREPYLVRFRARGEYSRSKVKIFTAALHLVFAAAHRGGEALARCSGSLPRGFSCRDNN